MRASGRSPDSQAIPDDCHPKIRALYVYWKSIHPNEGGLPARRHLDPVDIPKLLPNVWLIDVQHNPYRFRFRLEGTQVVAYAGEDNTGKWVDECMPNFDPRVLIDVVETREPSWARGLSRMRPDKDYYELERIRLPLASDGERVDMLFCMTIFYDKAGREISKS